MVRRALTGRIAAVMIITIVMVPEGIAKVTTATTAQLENMVRAVQAPPLNTIQVVGSGITMKRPTLAHLAELGLFLTRVLSRLVQLPKKATIRPRVPPILMGREPQVPRLMRWHAHRVNMQAVQARPVAKLRQQVGM